MVGRLPALKYLLAASSYSFQTSSTGCRHDTSACVCTSIATRSLMFIGVLGSAACGVPLCERTPLAHETREQRRRLPVQRTEQCPVLHDAPEHGPEPDAVGVEQRPAAIARKPVAGRPHDVDVTAAHRDALVENTQTLVDERIH